MAELVHYAWEPLPSNRHIRVIHLISPTTSDTPVYCDIETRSLDNPGRYHTLSYAWGQTYPDGSHLTDTIICDNQRMAVTNNLHLALRHLREDNTSWHRKHPIWIDAISINQRDDREKARQVLLMSEIFEKSRHLTIWLGISTNDYEATMAERISKLYQNWEDESVGDDYDEVDQNITSILLQQDEQDMLWRILQRDWFKRRWIIQEALVSNAEGHVPWFRFGPVGWNWPFFVFFVNQLSHDAGDPAARFLALAKRASNDSNLLGPRTQNEIRGRSILGSSSRPMFNTILETLHIFDYAECYDARDKIYALLSIAFGISEDIRFDVDYKGNVEEVYTKFAKSLIDSTQVYFLHNILIAASCRQDLGRLVHSLPSWVPDWRIRYHYVNNDHRLAVESSLNPFLKDRPHLREYHSFKGEGQLVLKAWLVRPCSCTDEQVSLTCTLHLLERHASIQPVGRDQVICLLPGCEIGFVLETNSSALKSLNRTRQDGWLLHHCFQLHQFPDALTWLVSSHFAWDKLIDVDIV